MINGKAYTRGVVGGETLKQLKRIADSLETMAEMYRDKPTEDKGTQEPPEGFVVELNRELERIVYGNRG